MKHVYLQWDFNQGTIGSLHVSYVSEQSVQRDKRPTKAFCGLICIVCQQRIVIVV